MQVELVADYRNPRGENPLWHPLEKRLYWRDMPEPMVRGRMFRYDPAMGSHEQCYEGEPVGGFTIQSDGALLLFGARGSVRIWREGKLTTVIDEIPDERETWFNDVIADPLGRVFCGLHSTKSRLGRLYRLDPDGSLRIVVEGLRTSNGMGFTLDRRQMYHTDTGPREIYLYDYDIATGDLSNRRLFVRTPPGQGSPDGLTVDAEGYVWSALAGGWCVVRYSPEGLEERRIEVPARKVTSLTFGGEDYADIYITTVYAGNRQQDGWGAGALFRARPGVRGLPEFFSRVGL